MSTTPPVAGSPSGSRIPPHHRIDRAGYADRRKHAGQIIALCGIVMSVAAATLLDMQTRRDELVIAADSLYEEQDPGRPLDPVAIVSTSSATLSIDQLAHLEALQAGKWDEYLIARRRDRLARDQFIERHNHRVYITGFCIVVTVVLAGAAAALAMVVIVPGAMPRWVTHPAEPIPRQIDPADARRALSGIAVARTASTLAQMLAVLSLIGLLGAADFSVMASGSIVGASVVVLAPALVFARVRGWLSTRRVSRSVMIDGVQSLLSVPPEPVAPAKSAAAPTTVIEAT
jgi:hypothetical protein